MVTLKLARASASAVMVSLFVAFTSPTSYAQNEPQRIVDPDRLVTSDSPYEFPFEKVDPNSQDLTLAFTDLTVPGNGGLDIVVTRSYNHTYYGGQDDDEIPKPGGPRLMGDRWELDIPAIYFAAQKTFLAANNSKSACRSGFSVYIQAGGSRQLKKFYPSPTTETSYSEISKDNWKAECLPPAEGASGRVIYSPDGRRMVFSRNPDRSFHWFLSKVTDKNGNWLQYNYTIATGGWDAWPVLNSISASDGRSVSFGYTYIRNRPHVTSLVGPGGTITYSYENYTSSIQPLGQVGNQFSADEYWSSARVRLSSVNYPDATKWSFTYTPYNPSYFGIADSLATVTSPSGGVISYVFNDIPGGSLATKTTSASLPAASWTFTSENGTQTVGRVVGPNFCRRTWFSLGTSPSPSGYPSWWDVGLTTQSIVYTDASCATPLQTETFTWDKRQLTPALTGGNGGYNRDIATYAPLLKSRTITRDGQSYSTTDSNWDWYGNPGTTVESGPNGGSRTIARTFYINTAKWLVDQLQNESYSGSSTTRGFDTNGNLTSISRDGVTTSATFDAQGNVSTVTYPRGLVHSYSNYKRGIAQAESQPEGINLVRVVSDAGNVVSETDGDGYTTTYGYDGLNRVTSVTRPVGAAKTLAYSATTKETTRGPLVESVIYDGLNRATSITLGGITTTYAFDGLGRQTFVSDPGGSSGTSYQHDALGRVTRVTNADSTYRTVSYGAGTQTETDERGKATTYSYRSFADPDQRWVIGITAPIAAANVGISRNGRNQITSVTQNGVTRTYTYNANYYLTAVSNPETGTTTYGRDIAGNLTSRVVGASANVTYSYDGQNRLISATYPAGTPNVTNTYNKRHRLLTSNTSLANHSYSYDGNGNLKGEVLLVGGTTFNTNYTYNNRDQLSTIVYPISGNVVSYAPNYLGRPTSVSGYVSSVSYWPSGLLKQILYANGTVSSYGQGSRLWPNLFAVKKGTSYYLHSSYGYDGVGNLTSISDNIDGSYARTMTFDALSRVVSTSGPWGAGSLSYDGRGNITSQAFGSYGYLYSYDSSNRLSSISGNRSASYSYDAYGDIVNDGSRTFGYDDVPTLRCVNCSGTTNKISYVYDGSNQRVSVTRGGVTTYEVYDPKGKLLIEFTPSQSNKLVEYIYLGNQRIAQRVTP